MGRHVIYRFTAKFAIWISKQNQSDNIEILFYIYMCIYFSDRFFNFDIDFEIIWNRKWEDKENLTKNVYINVSRNSKSASQTYVR